MRLNNEIYNQKPKYFGHITIIIRHTFYGSLAFCFIALDLVDLSFYLKSEKIFESLLIYSWKRLIIIMNNGMVKIISGRFRVEHDF